MKRCKKIALYLLPAVVIITIYILKTLYFRYIASLNIPCLVHLITGYWCPGCGGTRSVEALFKGNILTSLKYNPFVMLMVISAVLIYIRMILKSKGKIESILPENDNYIIVITIIMVIYYIARNFIPFLAPI